MKKIFSYLLMALVAICITLPVGSTAEAAKVAVVSLQTDREEFVDPPILYMESAVELFKFPDFDFVKEEDLDAAVGKGLSDFSRATLERVATETGADIVIAMSLDTFETKSLMFRREEALQLDISGKFAYLNKLTNKYSNSDYKIDDIYEEVLFRREISLEREFKNFTTREMKKIIKIK